ncbi:MAG TPA: hypothetical protein VG323_19190 [Thermoanaerobaculia bacterium]|nr:hypothetical protein [Thermoanaerobaculia bacterium]
MPKKVPPSRRLKGRKTVNRDTAKDRVSRVYGIAGKGNTEEIMSRLRARG